MGEAKEISYKIQERTLLLENADYNFEEIGSMMNLFPI